MNMDAVIGCVETQYSINPTNLFDYLYTISLDYFIIKAVAVWHGN